MSVEEIMETHGFRIAASCAGTAHYTKSLKHEGKRAYISITDTSGDNVPVTLDESVQVAILALRSGDELEPAETVSSLSSYLETLGG